MNRIRTNTPGSAGAAVRLFLLTLGLALAAASCGQQGPLYLPQKDAAGDEAAANSHADTSDTYEDEDTDEETP